MHLTAKVSFGISFTFCLKVLNFLFIYFFSDMYICAMVTVIFCSLLSKHINVLPSTVLFFYYFFPLNNLCILGGDILLYKKNSVWSWILIDSNRWWCDSCFAEESLFAASSRYFFSSSRMIGIIEKCWCLCLYPFRP